MELTFYHIFVLALIYFLQFIYIFIFIDIIFSWLSVLWLRYKPKFITDTLAPIYSWIKNLLPTNIWPLDFTPIILIFFIIFLSWLLNTLI